MTYRATADEIDSLQEAIAHGLPAVLAWFEAQVEPHREEAAEMARMERDIEAWDEGFKAALTARAQDAVRWRVDNPYRVLPSAEETP